MLLQFKIIFLSLMFIFTAHFKCGFHCTVVIPKIWWYKRSEGGWRVETEFWHLPYIKFVPNLQGQDIKDTHKRWIDVLKLVICVW